jgi:hypothetical protein
VQPEQNFHPEWIVGHGLPPAVMRRPGLILREV